VFVGCSGNFTIERVLEDRFKLHGNDVTLYSCAIGSYLAGAPLELEVIEERLDWLREYMDTPAGALACVLLGSAVPSPYAKLDSKQRYYERMRQAWREQWPDLHRKTVEKIEKQTLKLETFESGDAVDWITALPEDAAVVCYPPFYAGDYEQQGKWLDETFSWPKPEYPLLDEERMQMLIDNLLARDRFMYGNYQRRPDLEKHLIGVVQTTNRGLPLYVYGNAGVHRIARPHQQTEHVLSPRLGIDEDLGDKIALAPLTGGQFSTLRSQYMNHNIKPGSPLLALAVLVDGKVIGCFAFGSMRSNSPTDCYLLSDFPVSSTKYERLARLIVACGLSYESQQLMQRSASRRMRTISTTAFSQRPASMKYRGLLRLVKRSDSPDPLYKFQLQYAATLGEYTLQEALATWKKKHGDKVREMASA